MSHSWMTEYKREWGRETDLWHTQLHRLLITGGYFWLHQLALRIYEGLHKALTEQCHRRVHTQ